MEDDKTQPSLSAQFAEGRLTDFYSTTIILRLVLNERGGLVHGELLNMNAELFGRFIGWREMMRLLRSWLVSQKLQDRFDQTQRDIAHLQRR